MRYSRQLEWRDRAGDHDLRVDRVEQRNGRVAVAISWAEREGTRQEWARLLRLRDGMIIDVQDYRSGERALRALRHRRAPLPGCAGLVDRRRGPKNCGGLGGEIHVATFVV